MTVVRGIIGFTVAVSVLTFIAFFGRTPAFRNTPIGFCHRLLIHRIPSALRALDVFLTNGRITSGGSRLGNHLMNEKHPVVMIFFLGLITISASLLVPTVWSLLPFHHKLLVAILLPQPYYFTHLCAKRNPETIVTEMNHAVQMRHYPYDRILYYPANACRTCKFNKPARSKHCSICKACVSRADHHCVWVNNCLGRGNHKWFLALLLSTAILLAYGAYIAYFALSPKVHKQYARYESWYRFKPSPGSNPSSWATYGEKKLHYFLTYVSIYIDEGGVSAAGVGLLALLTWPLPLGLLCYHLYLIYAGMTTNESSKWADWADEIADGNVFLGKRRPETMRDYRATDADLHDSARSSSSATPMPTPPETPPEDEEPPTSWPLESRHILVRTTNGQPPTGLPPRIKSVANIESFERVWDLAAVENVYDLGFWDTFFEILLH
ncbi:palmitoyltransferase swf1 [Paraphaeosphaeria sporulosa]|uniref:Palmitoyltransferase n=1 Tax=Paraphaeosphaeria sporulosa TaxID=1460663 RepID=A0A177BYY8_9PLEO|nr:palmitoyltransferase swf1 [Paraphaeosphaeria sporulosa]OAG00181.1 palmitoyltransferase swf1 [Paraphaeosphaeria sporulosa]